MKLLTDWAVICLKVTSEGRSLLIPKASVEASRAERLLSPEASTIIANRLDWRNLNWFP